MFRELTAQFSIVRMREHAGFRKLLTRAAHLGVGHVDGVLRRPDRALPADGLCVVGERAPLLRARPRRHPRHRGRPADQPVEPETDDGLFRPRRCGVLRGAAVRRVSCRDLRDLHRGGLRVRLLPARLLLGDPEPRERGLARSRERARPGGREPLHALRPGACRRRQSSRSGRIRCTRSMPSASCSRRCSSSTSAADSSRACRPGSAGRTGARCGQALRSSRTTSTSPRSSSSGAGRRSRTPASTWRRSCSRRRPTGSAAPASASSWPARRRGS